MNLNTSPTWRDIPKTVAFWILSAAILAIIAASMLFAVATTVVIAIVVAIIALPAVAYHGYTGRWPDWFKVQVIRREIDD